MPDQMPISERDQAPPENITTNITADQTNSLTQKTQNFVIIQTLANAARLEADHSQNPFVFNFYKNIRSIAMLLFATLPAEDPATGETVNRAGIRHFFGGTTPTAWLDERLSNIGAEHPHLQSACDALRHIITNNHPDFVENAEFKK